MSQNNFKCITSNGMNRCFLKSDFLLPRDEKLVISINFIFNKTSVISYAYRYTVGRSK